MSFGQYLDEPDVRERFVEGSIKQGKVQIKDFSDFKDALMNYMQVDFTKGREVTALLDENDFIRLFKEEKIKNEIRKNNKDEADKIFDAVDRTDAEIIRSKPIGTPVRRTQVFAGIIPKPVKVKGYKGTDTHFRGKPRRFNDKEVEYLKNLKSKKLTAKQISYEYNRKYVTNPRSESSLTTKVYRLK